MKIQVRKEREEKTGKVRFQAYTYSPIVTCSKWHPLEISAVNEIKSILRARGVR